MQRSGVGRRVLTRAACGLLLVASACIPYGFAGGGLPRTIRTVAVIPFDNETASPEVQRELREIEEEFGPTEEDGLEQH